MTDRTTRLALAIALGLAPAACESGSAGYSGPEVTDSAGVEIVENTRPKWPDGGGWRLSASAKLDIGVVEGDDEYQFFEITGAVELGDGRIVVANSGTGELRFFDASGSFI